MKSFCAAILLSLPTFAQTTEPPSVDRVVDAYVQALGGPAVLEQITAREVQGRLHHGSKLLYYWQKPDLVLMIEGKNRSGFDGSNGWTFSKRKRVQRLGRGDQLPIENCANPARYAQIKQLYPDITAGPAETTDAGLMDVLIAPNNIASTKFYFDSKTHLLSRIEEKGETSAYFVQTYEFLDYRKTAGSLFPFRIVHRTTDAGARSEDFRVAKVMVNPHLDPEIFSKPRPGTAVFGGKR